MTIFKLFLFWWWTRRWYVIWKLNVLGEVEVIGLLSDYERASFAASSLVNEDQEYMLFIEHRGKVTKIK